MTIYQEEMQRKANRHGCETTYDEEPKRLQVIYNGQHLMAMDVRGYMYYTTPDQPDEDVEALRTALLEEGREVREYVEAYEAAPQMKPRDVRNYRKLSEFRDTVLAAMYSPAIGFMFCSWKQSKDGTSVAHGDYSQDYAYSKESFAVRAGLIKEERLFSLEESIDLHKCIQYAKDYCGSLTSDQEKNLLYLEEKLWDAYPQLEETRPTFDEDEEMQFNM